VGSGSLDEAVKEVTTDRDIGDGHQHSVPVRERMILWPATASRRPGSSAIG
jgi:hypothetical protein